MLKTMLSFLCHYRIFNPLYRIILSNKTDIPELNRIKRETQIVVSLYCEEETFDKLHYTLYSIFNQKVSPDKVVLWLSNRYELSELPYSITKFVKSGLDVRFVDDAGSYTKIIYALKEFKDSIIVTADENIYYPKNWLLKLYHSYISNPEDIHVHGALEIASDKNKIHSVKEWRFAHTEGAEFRNFPVSVNGVLYPPNCFIKDILREDIYKKKADVEWDIWSWVISVVSNRKIRLVKNHIRMFSSSGMISGYRKYSVFLNKPEFTDEKLRHLLEYYGKNVYSNLNRN